jgi:hypothetical protein
VSVYEGGGRNVAGLYLPLIGSVTAGDKPELSFAVADAAGRPVAVISQFLRDMTAGDMPASSCRSYGMLCRARHNSAWASRVRPR